MAGRALLRLAFAVGSLLPRSADAPTARTLGRLQWRFARRRREAVLSNLQAMAQGGVARLRDASARERVARAMFESYGRFLVEFFSRDRAQRGRGPRFILRGTERLYAALARGRGAVLVAPHTGNWELAASELARGGFRLHVVTGVQLHPGLTRAMRAAKEREGIRVSTPSDGFTPLLATLRRGGLVVLLLDGDVHSASLPTQFLSAEASLPTGPALLARRARAPLVHVHTHRSPEGHHVIEIAGVDEPDPSRPLAPDLARLTARAAGAVGATIVAHLDQWCIFRPLLVARERTGRARVA